MERYFFLLLLAIHVFIAKAQLDETLLPATGEREQLIHHKGFSLSYNPSYVQPSWVAYKVSESRVIADEVKGKYRADPMVTSRSADKKDYKEGGYIMAQFVNYLDIKNIPDAVEESFFMTNITPMKLAYYKHIWLKIEELVRLWSKDPEGLFVVCGAILSDAPFPTIGDNKVSVPTRYYKAVYDPENHRAIGFIFRNGMSSGKLSSYAVSIDEIEKETGLDLFPSLEDDLEERVESEVNFSSWDFELIE
jgi:endonuclease G